MKFTDNKKNLAIKEHLSTQDLIYNNVVRIMYVTFEIIVVMFKIKLIV